ncbi:MAG: single-stranded DNA-binding protein [Salinibacterium sp.]|nr:single-stranded DNA-binding protein [Salinibacterium sp.]
MPDNITITGLVATEPRHIVTSESLVISSFRVVSTQRRFDRSTQKWIDGDTNWFTITAFRNLAAHVSASVHKGDRVLVTGRLRIREWQTDERAGTTVDIEADAIGHDLAWGTSSFSRAVSASATSAAAESEATSPADDAAEAGSDADSEGAAEAETDAEGEESTEKENEFAGLPF